MNIINIYYHTKGRTLFKVDGVVWGWDPIKDCPWRATEELYEQYSADWIQEMAYVTKGSAEYEMLKVEILHNYPNHKIIELAS